MNESFGSTPAARHNEQGTARLKFIIVLVVVALVGYMGFQYIPVAYQSYTFKKFMDESADKAAASALPAEQKGSWLENELRTNAKDYGVPPDAKMTHIFQNNRMEITVTFTRQINLLPGFAYQYNFDHTAKSSTFLTPQ
ncbi:MAG: hypothetical protein QOH25_3400 [Acidobacteriota bacterium]|jgi:hypothetical protein|nr:hypothetical protein [Acidobacteriota bacterium]